MNNRDYKNFSKGSLYHIYNRGNNREKIFYNEEDYQAFLFRIGLVLGFEMKDLKHELLSVPYSRIRITKIKKNIFLIHAFCLMPNHFHILIEQCSDIPISKFISKVCSSYAQYINRKYKRVGHIFQDQFKAVLIESNVQLMWTSSYIHTNPVKDKITEHLSQYKWSSYNDYASDRNLPIIEKKLLLETFGSKANFKKETSPLNQDDMMSLGISDM